MVKKIQLSHSAQQLKGIDPDIIHNEKGELDPLRDEQARQKVVSVIDSIISHGKKLCISKEVTAYYNTEGFVIKSIPVEIDDYERRSPILSYGKFPDGDTAENWVEIASEDINVFVCSINRTLSNETLENIKKGLQDAEKDKGNLLRKRQMEKILISSAICGILIAEPLLLGLILHKQVPQILQELTSQQTIPRETPKPTTFQSPPPIPRETPKPTPKPTISQSPPAIPRETPKPTTFQSPQAVSLLTLQRIIQKLIMLMAIIITVNNALLLILLKLPIRSFLNQKYRNNFK